MKLKSLFIYLMLPVILYSCMKKQDTDHNQHKIIGNWKWQSTDGGIGNHIHETPASTGKNILLRFKEDNRCLVFENGLLTSEGTYTLNPTTCIHDHTIKEFIDFSSANDSDMMVERNVADILYLSDENNDGSISRYSFQP